jgi:hypothetical protein
MRLDCVSHEQNLLTKMAREYALHPQRRVDATDPYEELQGAGLGSRSRGRPPRHRRETTARQSILLCRPYPVPGPFTLEL